MAWSDLPPRPNLLLLITDQQRAARHWPPGWAERNLPALTRLMRTGMTFENAFCAACECSPSRASFVTSTYPQVNGLTTTQPNINLPLPADRPNLATVLGAAGYDVQWRGKWHLFADVYQCPPPSTHGDPGAGPQPPDNLDAYGFGGWDPPDAGTTLNLTLLGGGTPGPSHCNGNDPRYVSGPGGALDYLQAWQAQPASGRKPFCLVVSLVNPHDVHVYVQDYASVGFGDEFEQLDIALPGNFADSLEHKPRAQGLFRAAFDRQHPFAPAQGITPEGYVKFYAYLAQLSDALLGQVLDTLDALDLTDSTLVVRFADHGEMGMSHGLREKMVNAYEETIHVPLVFSNPLAFPRPLRTFAFASLVDLLPTLATVAGTEPPAKIAGVDLTPVLSGAAASVQPEVLWAYDDNSGVPGSVAANHIRALRTEGWMYAVYFSENEPDVPLEFELYSLSGDRGELNNLLNPLQVTVVQWQALHHQLTELLEAKGGLPPGVAWPTQVDEQLLDITPLTLPVEDLALGVTVPMEGK